jgi:hypothetical protein
MKYDPLHDMLWWVRPDKPRRVVRVMIGDKCYNVPLVLVARIVSVVSLGSLLYLLAIKLLATDLFWWLRS